MPLSILKMLNGKAGRDANHPHRSSSAPVTEQNISLRKNGHSSQDLNDDMSDQDETLPWGSSPYRDQAALNKLPSDSSSPRSTSSRGSPTSTPKLSQHNLASSQVLDSPTEDVENDRPADLHDSSVDLFSNSLEPRTVQSDHLHASPRTAVAGFVVESADEDSSSPKNDLQVALASSIGEVGRNAADTSSDGEDVTSQAGVGAPPESSSEHIKLGNLVTASSGSEAEVLADLPSEHDVVMQDLAEVPTPSTGPERPFPYTQIERTPYVNGCFGNPEFLSTRPVQGPEYHQASSESSGIEEFVENSAPTQDNKAATGSGKILKDEHLHYPIQDRTEANRNLHTLLQLEIPSRSPTLKRRENTFPISAQRHSKRLKAPADIDMFLPETGSQEDGERMSPAILADKNRREFFERRSSAGSGSFSMPVSPAVPHRIRQATMKTLAPMRSNRASISIPTADTKIPSRLRESSTRLYSAHSVGDAASIDSRAAISPTMDHELVHKVVSEAASVAEQATHGQDPVKIDQPEQGDAGADPVEQENTVFAQELIAEGATVSDEDDTAFVERGRHNAVDAKPTSHKHSSNSRLDTPKHEGEPLHGVPDQEGFGRSSPHEADRHTEPPKSANVSSPTQPSTLYERFTSAYPIYGGNTKHFRSLCIKLSRILETGSIIPAYLLDDFVIRHKLEYQNYLQQCAEEGEDADSYYKYYSENTTKALFTKRILSHHELLEIYGGVESVPTSRRHSAVILEHDTEPHEAVSIGRVHDPRQRKPMGSASPRFPEPPPTLRAASPEIQLSSSVLASRPQEPRVEATRTNPPVTIDLTIDDHSDLEAAIQTKAPNSRIKGTPSSQRVLPWTASSGSLEHSSRKSRIVDLEAAQLAKIKRPALQVGRSIRQPEEAPRREQSQNRQGDEERTASSQRGPLPLHEDPSSPYNTWKRNMDAVTPAKGNSFASEGQRRLGREIRKQRLAIGQRRPRI